MSINLFLIEKNHLESGEWRNYSRSVEFDRGAIKGKEGKGQKKKRVKSFETLLRGRKKSIPEQMIFH